uniref:Dicer-like protein 4 n=1 Tax=Nelumbo nucifera TaxID=4432 RepID=A0A822ZQE8_NELNU|nr:TPA_asm: hypothetical protein HUJ06_003386 [Nelumbo nucifera]
MEVSSNEDTEQSDTSVASSTSIHSMDNGNRSRALKDPRIIARSYQLELCKKALKENVIVYLGTGCGKTHIAVLLMYELRHLISKPKKNVCVFLAPTVPLVRQQAKVIEDSINFKVGSYFGNSRRLKSHLEWEKETEQYEVLVMTPQILIRNLHHCFMRMELIELLIFDECHHAQATSSHPYAQIMKEFYYATSMKRPRIFGMTASPVVGKDQVNLPKCINSLEKLLDAKVYSVEDEELENFVASPKVKVYYYGPGIYSISSCSFTCSKKLEEIRSQCISSLSQNTGDRWQIRKNKKLLRKLHENMIFCLQNLGLWGAKQAASVLLSGDRFEWNELTETEDNSCNKSVADQYLSQTTLVFDSYFNKDGMGSDSSCLEALKEPFFSEKLLALLEILSNYRLQENMKCIVFVNRIIVARSLSCIIKKLKCLEAWRCDFLVGLHSGMKAMSRKTMNSIVEKFRSGELNLLVATKVGEEGLDIQTCCLVIRFDLPETVASFIQSRGRARMPQSEYAFLVDRGNQSELHLINNFVSDENQMNKEITCRSSLETFDFLEESTYKVDSTGASITAGYSVSLLYHYCSKLPHDEYFNPKPEFFYFNDSSGTVCHLILPSNAAIHQVVSMPQPSKEAAKRNVCLKACKELHLVGALTDHLLPGQDGGKAEGLFLTSSGSEISEGLTTPQSCEEEGDQRELHEMLIPAAFRVPWTNLEDRVTLNFYFLRFNPVPEDRVYKKFGLFVKEALPIEAENMEVDLHLAHGRNRIVKTKLCPFGVIEFDQEEMKQAEYFQELFLKLILNRSELFPDFVPLGKNDSSQASSSTFYLLLPVKQHEYKEKMTVDWEIVKRCLSSPVFRVQINGADSDHLSVSNSLRLASGPRRISDIVNSLVYCPHRKLFFFVAGILPGINGYSPFPGSRYSSYSEYYIQKFGIHLSYPEQSLLKAKQLFRLNNLLHNRLQENAEPREVKEHFVELPPELCSLRIIGFSKEIGSSLSLLPSIVHRLENFLVAIELKGILSASFPEASEVTAHRILEALTTENCLERFSLERLEILGDAFLKYAVGRSLFLSYEALDEGQLTGKRSNIVNNSNLYKLATQRNLQVYIRDQAFNPCQFFALGHPCPVICNKEIEKTIHSQQERCNKNHHWLQRKTIADVVEALVGAFIVDSGLKAATAFLRWIGIQVDYEASQVSKFCTASKGFMSLADSIDVGDLEKSLGHHFLHKGLLLQAFVHPSYNKLSGGSFQRLEFLGDAVLDYLITSYLYSVYPKLKPGQLTDLRSLSVSNISFADVAVSRSFHKYLIYDSDSLCKAINEYVNFIQRSASEKSQLEGPKCPKVLGDLVESCVGAILLDTGLNLKNVWKIMLLFLDPIMSFSSLQLNPVRELQEFCQSHNWKLKFQYSNMGEKFLVEAQVNGKDICLTSSAININKRAAQKMTAQKLFSKLKVMGYKPKSSLEGSLRSTKKQEAKLIGYDETPIDVIFPDLDPMEVPEASMYSREQTSEFVAITSQPPLKFETSREHYNENSENSGTGEPQTSGTEQNATAKSRLYEICTYNYWKSPIFECYKEEGLDHLKQFTFKVVVEIEEAADLILECFSSPHAKKKAAAEHAAEGALWYLQQQGYLCKGD